MRPPPQNLSTRRDLEHYVENIESGEKQNAKQKVKGRTRAENLTAG